VIMLREEQLSGLIRDWVTTNHQGNDAGVTDFGEDDDLLASGALDSMGFIELLVHVESIIGKKIDLTDLDPNEFTSIRGLSQNLLNSWSKTA